MDYKIVADILRELNVSLRAKLNPDDTLPFMKIFTPAERDRVECRRRHDGPQPANDELLFIVRTKPKSFIHLLVSMIENHNEELFNTTWRCTVEILQKKNRYEQIDALRSEIDAFRESLHQPGQAVGREENRGRSEIEPARQYMGVQLPGEGAILYQRRPEIESRPQLLPLQGPAGLQAGNERSSGARPKLTSLSSDSSSGPISTAASTCASPNDNDFLERDIDALDMTVVEPLGKELERKHEDGKAYWEHVLTYLKLKVSLGDKKNIKKSDNPGEQCLEFLGDKEVKIGQLREALLMKNLRHANQILLGEAAAGSLSEEDNINQMHSMGAERAEGPTKNIAPYTSLPLNNLNTGSQKPGTGKKLNLSTQSANDDFAGQHPVSSDNDDNSREDNLESGGNVSASVLYPSATQSLSNDPNIPSVTAVASSSADRALTPREINSSLSETLDSSVDATTNTDESALNLKETRPNVAVGDPERKEAVLNPDIELNKLVDDREGQLDILGNNSDSFGYVDLQNRQQTETVREDKSQEAQSQQESSSVSSLRQPDLVLANVGEGMVSSENSQAVRRCEPQEDTEVEVTSSGTAELGDTSNTSALESNTSGQVDIDALTQELANASSLNAASLQENSTAND